MTSRTSPPGAYVARFGFDPRTSMGLIGCIAVAAVFVWIPAEDVIVWVMKVTGVLLFGFWA